MSKTRAVNSFFKSLGRQSITFDDVSLLPRYADFLPKDADITSRLTRRIKVNIPFVSAAMDTVTESKMAIAMAMLGGIGIIHKNLDISRQCREVEIVKHYLNGLILHPITFRASDTLAYVKEIRIKNGYGFFGFPILDERDMLAGILTSADMKFAHDPNARVSDIMTKEVISAGPGTTLKKAYEIMKRNKIGKLPLVDKGKLVGLYSFSDVSTLIENAQPLFNRDDRHRLRVGAAVGPADYQRAEALAEKDADVLVIDTAHGHSRNVIKMCAWIRKKMPGLDIIAGNIATGEAAKALLKAGADAVKVGIGPGSICTTRVIAGVGIPQISAIYQCAQALKSAIPIVADGGIRYTGDVAKAIVAGADTVMMGSALAGTDESPGEKIIHQGRQYVIYRGMGSLAAMKTGAGSRERYGQMDAREEELIPQGIEGIVPYAGNVAKVLVQYAGGLRASMGYCGTRTTAALQSNGSFTLISPAGGREGHPHDVKIIKEAPNYSLNA
ncbi:MAG: IMP dehydrogenase [Kiritimatiellae bacterium]|nr:IMP dehydrogenase [Kiritimatiellia bacterium]